MPKTFTDLAALLDHGFDTLIDVRSPAEFAEDHVPGAINLPVLSNEERAEVGTIYVQKSSFLARKIGAALVFRNAAGHIEGPLKDKPGDWRPLVYCWRGGQRSGALGWMLAQIGWRAEVIEGGYRTYRRLVTEALYDRPLRHRIVLLDGYTGTAKTDLLHRLADRGVQMLDLEGMAEHRGSLLGEMATGQPSQKMFDSRIAGALCRLDPGRPVLVEAESSKIGARLVPPSLWAAMKAAPRIEVTAPLESRARYLVKVYDDILSDSPRLTQKLGLLRGHRGHAVVDGWMALIARGDKAALTRALMEEHYDPSYTKSRKANGARTVASIAADKLDEEGLEQAAAQIAAELEQMGQAAPSEI